jgi:hypothetical protein
MRRLLLGLLLGLLVSACGSTDAGSGPPPAPTGVSGVTVVDRGCPVEQPAKPCPTSPVRARVIARKIGSTDVVAQTTSAKDGSFVLRLEPGRYALVAQAAGGAPFPRAEHVTVVVKPGAMAEVRIRMDSGIRALAQ